MKFNIICADPPYGFSDGLVMSSVARGAETNYSILSIEEIKKLKVNELTAEDSILALWVPSSLLQEGLDVMSAWGFRQTQTHVWVKIKIDPFGALKKSFRKFLKTSALDSFEESINEFNLNDMLAFGMGRLFRQCHEICLIGVKGKVYKHIANKSQRSVHFAVNTKHSAKPEALQDMLELMWPGASVKKLELFARRTRADWRCVGNQCNESLNVDIRDSIEELINE